MDLGVEVGPEGEGEGDDRLCRPLCPLAGEHAVVCVPLVITHAEGEVDSCLPVLFPELPDLAVTDGADFDEPTLQRDEVEEVSHL